MPHYSPYSLEVVFTRPILMEHNVCLSSFHSRETVVAVLFYQCQHFALTVIVPRSHPHHNCWAILQPMALDSFLPGRKGDPTIWLFPSCTSPDFIAMKKKKHHNSGFKIHRVRAIIRQCPARMTTLSGQHFGLLSGK